MISKSFTRAGQVALVLPVLLFAAAPAFAQAALGGIVGGTNPQTAGANFLNMFLALCMLAVAGGWAYIGGCKFYGHPHGQRIMEGVVGTLLVVCCAFFATYAMNGGSVAGITF